MQNSFSFVLKKIYLLLSLFNEFSSSKLTLCRIGEENLYAAQNWELVWFMKDHLEETTSNAPLIRHDLNSELI